MASTLQPLLDGQNGARTESTDLAIRVDHIIDDGPHNDPSPRNSEDLDKYHQHYSDRAPWLRAAVLGANDGLVSVASIMLGVSGGSTDKHTLILSGLSALVAGELRVSHCLTSPDGTARHASRSVLPDFPVVTPPAPCICCNPSKWIMKAHSMLRRR